MRHLCVTLALVALATWAVAVPSTQVLSNLRPHHLMSHSDTSSDSGPLDDRIILGNGSAWAYASMPNCGESGTLNYDTATNAFSCLTDSGAGASLSVTQVELDFGSVLCRLTGPVGDANAPDHCEFTVTDALVTTASKIMISQSGIAGTSADADENDMDQIACVAFPGTGDFVLFCRGIDGGPVYGRFKFNYIVG